MGNSRLTGDNLAQRASNAEKFPFDGVIIVVNEVGICDSKAHF